jgi:glycosyltransferase involved in cell wall biosynthesis
VRIVLATDWWPPRVGGIESQVADLAAELASRGHSVRVLTATSNPDPLAGVSIDAMDWPIVGGAAVPDLRRVSAIAAYLKEAAPDVVHAHGMFFSVSIGAILAASRLGIPSVSTVHSLLRPWPIFLAGRAVFQLFSNRADVITAVSAATASDVARASRRDVVRIPNGLHLDRWRASSGPAPDVPREAPHSVVRGVAPGVSLLAVMRLVPKKSPVDVIRALHAARLRRPDVTLTVIGDGPERPRLEREATRLGVAGHVRLLGACSREHVRQSLAEAAILVHPGQLEAFGLALLEARAAGVPVVAMASGGVPDLVADRVHGLLARTRREFPSAVAELAGDDNLRRRCSERAPLDLDAFDWPQVAAQFEAAYVHALHARAFEGGHRAPHDRRDGQVAGHDGERGVRLAALKR